MAMRRFAALGIACVVATAAAGTLAAGTAASQTARTETTSSVVVTPISVPQGTLRIYLPPDMAAGDTISGTVVAEPAGNTDAQRNANSATLEGYVIDVGPAKASAAKRAFTFVLPATALATAIVVRTSKGAEAGRVNLPVHAQQPPFARPALPNDYHFPQVVAAGQPFAIRGPFSGDAQKSTLAVGGQPADIIAESPRTLVAAPAPNVSGPATYQLNERGVAVWAPCNVASLNLSAPKTSVTKGAHTALHVAVGGLGGIRQPVYVRLVNATPDVVSLAGGQTQVLTIRPTDVAENRTYAADRDLTGLRAGAFSLYALLDDQNQQVADGASATGPPGPRTTTRPGTVPEVPRPETQRPGTQPLATPHAARNPITSDWPALSDDDKKSVQSFLDAAAASKTAAGVRKAREDALAQLVKVMKKYCCNFDTMAGGAPVYDPATEGEGATDRAKGGGVSIGSDAFTSVAWLYSSLKHEMVHSQQWQDPDAAGKAGSKGREREAYQREVDQAKNTGLSDAEKAEDQHRLEAYK